MYKCIQIYIYHVKVCKCIKAEKSQTDDSKAYVHFKGGDGDAGGRGWTGQADEMFRADVAGEQWCTDLLKGQVLEPSQT